MVQLILGFFLLAATNTYAENTVSYQGVDKGKACFLYVHSETEANSTYQVEVSTSYEHAGEGLGKVILEFGPDSQGKVLEWQNPATKEFLRVLLKKPNQTLAEPSAFRLKWMHFDHLHDATCSELKLVGEK